MDIKVRRLSSVIGAARHIHTVVVVVRFLDDDLLVVVVMMTLLNNDFRVVMMMVVLRNSKAALGLLSRRIIRNQQFHRIAYRRKQFGIGASTTLAESVCVAVFQGFVFCSADTAETVAEG